MTFLVDETVIVVYVDCRVFRWIYLPHLCSAAWLWFWWSQFRYFYIFLTWPDYVKVLDDISRGGRGAVWFLLIDSTSQHELCVLYHTGLRAHTRPRSTIHMFQTSFFWSTIAVPVESSVHSKIHFLSMSRAEKFPSLFGPAIYSRSPGSLTKFGFVDTGPFSCREKCVLMVRDHHLSYYLFSVRADSITEYLRRGIINCGAVFWGSRNV